MASALSVPHNASVNVTPKKRSVPLDQVHCRNAVPSPSNKRAKHNTPQSTALAVDSASVSTAQDASKGGVLADSTTRGNENVSVPGMSVSRSAHGARLPVKAASRPEVLTTTRIDKLPKVTDAERIAREQRRDAEMAAYREKYRRAFPSYTFYLDGFDEAMQRDMQARVEALGSVSDVQDDLRNSPESNPDWSPLLLVESRALLLQVLHALHFGPCTLGEEGAECASRAGSRRDVEKAPRQGQQCWPRSKSAVRQEPIRRRQKIRRDELGSEGRGARHEGLAKAECVGPDSVDDRRLRLTSFALQSSSRSSIAWRRSIRGRKNPSCRMISRACYIRKRCMVLSRETMVPRGKTTTISRRAPATCWSKTQLASTVPSLSKNTSAPMMMTTSLGPSSTMNARGAAHSLDWKRGAGSRR